MLPHSPVRLAPDASRCRLGPIPVRRPHQRGRGADAPFWIEEPTHSSAIEEPIPTSVIRVQDRIPVLLVLHFGVVHEDDCRELSTTRDWVPLEDVPEGTLGELELQQCPVCRP